jgi:large subunit ribosomal protein L13
MPKGKQINRKFHLFDAKKKVLGRMATEIATVLRGKNKADFAPNVAGGDFAVVINSDNVKVTGNKLEGKVYHYYSGYPGGVRNLKLKDALKNDSRKVVQEAVYGMLPKNKLRKPMMTRLKIYKDDKHEHKVEITH